MASSGSADPPAAVAAAKGKAKAKPRGKAKAAPRPTLDLDDEIEEANRLASMSRKMMQAAKAIEKANKRSKTRLLRKAGQLSAEDLERIAVLKRCGLYADDSAGEGESPPTEASGAEPSAVSPPPAKLAPKKQRLADLLSSDESGARALLDSIRESFPSLTQAGNGKGHASGSARRDPNGAEEVEQVPPGTPAHDVSE